MEPKAPPNSPVLSSHERSFIEGILPKDFDLDQTLSSLGITVEVIPNCDPFQPAEVDIHIHKLDEAIRRAQGSPLNNAAEATCNRRGDGPAKCYQGAAQKAGPEIPVERSILHRDIRQPKPQVYKNLLVFCFSEYYDNAPAHNLLARAENDWPKLLQDSHTELPHDEAFGKAAKLERSITTNT